MALKRISRIILSVVLASSPVAGYTQGAFVSALPVPGTMVSGSMAFTPVLLKGLVVRPDQPLDLEFIVDSGNDADEDVFIKEQTSRIAKYFLAALTVPDEQLWVNLSPYEKDRVIEDELGQTVLGRDMLAQDYVLKQLTASLIYPGKGFGKEFWKKVYQQAQEKFGITDIPMDTFNKVWIMPQTAEIFENGLAVYVTKASLKVMLDADHGAMAMQDRTAGERMDSQAGNNAQEDIPKLSREILREVILPAIEKEVNEGKDFSAIRQIYHAAILAKWYKECIKDTLLSKAYIGANKIAGIESDEKMLKEQIYQRYMTAYKKGVFNYIQEESDLITGERVARKYFSGGAVLGNISFSRTNDSAMVAAVGTTFHVDMAMKSADPSMKVQWNAKVFPVISIVPVKATENDLLFQQGQHKNKRRNRNLPSGTDRSGPAYVVQISSEARALATSVVSPNEVDSNKEDSAMKSVASLDLSEEKAIDLLSGSRANSRKKITAYIESALVEMENVDWSPQQLESLCNMLIMLAWDNAYRGDYWMIRLIGKYFRAAPLASQARRVLNAALTSIKTVLLVEVFRKRGYAVYLEALRKIMDVVKAQFKVEDRLEEDLDFLVEVVHKWKGSDSIDDKNRYETRLITKVYMEAMRGDYRMIATMHNYLPLLDGPDQIFLYKVLARLRKAFIKNYSGKVDGSDLMLKWANEEIGARIDAPSTIGNNVDNAATNGGIDIQGIQVSAQGNTQQIQFNDKVIELALQGEFSGFTPVILNITVVSSPQLLLGISKSALSIGLR